MPALGTRDTDWALDWRVDCTEQSRTSLTQQSKDIGNTGQ